LTRRGGRSPERAQRVREAPAAKTRRPRHAKVVENLRGCFGGDARGAEKGAQPHNRPRLAPRREGVPNSAEGAESRARRAASCLSPKLGKRNRASQTAQTILNSKKAPGAETIRFPPGAPFWLIAQSLVQYLRLAEVHIGLTHGYVGVNRHGVQVFIQGQHIAKSVEPQPAANPKAQFRGLQVE